MTTPIRSDFIVHYAAPPKNGEHRSNLVNGKAAYTPRLHASQALATLNVFARRTSGSSMVVSE